MKVAALQMSSQAIVSDNLQQAELLLERASAQQVGCALLPEACFFLGSESERGAVAETFQEGEVETTPGPMHSALVKWARGFDMWLIAGGVPETSADPLRPYNTSLVISPEGRFVARYRKLHLFDVELDDNRTWKESQGTMPGDAPIVADVANLKVGLSICYDLRFPELFAWQKAAGAQVLTLPASFTKMTGEAHWMVLLRARAIENQCYLVAAAQEGTHPLGRQTFGHAAVIDPWGGVLAVCTHPGPGLAVADIDVGIIDEVRRKMPLDRHRHGFNH